MHKTFTLFLLIAISQVPGCGQQYAQKKYTPPDTRILFVFDASQSMMGYWSSDRKINIARRTLISIIDSLETLDNVQMGLRVYGH